MTQSGAPVTQKLPAQEGLFLQPEWRFRPWGQLQRKPLDATSGRGSLALIDHPRGILLERAYRHGGLRRFLFPDWFWHHGRASQEYKIHVEVFEKNIPTVEPAGWREKAGRIPGWRQYWFYTVYLPGSCTLPQWFTAGNSNKAVPQQMADILWKLYQAGIYHSDLNLNNWLIWVADVRLIDFDGARHMDWDRGTYVITCIKRILRSGIKLGFSSKRFFFFRFLIHFCQLMQLPTRHVLAQLPANATQVSLLTKLGWVVGGGHRKKA